MNLIGTQRQGQIWCTALGRFWPGAGAFAGKNAEYVLKCLDFVLKCWTLQDGKAYLVGHGASSPEVSDFLFKIIDFVYIMMNFASKMMDFVFKLMNFGRRSKRGCSAMKCTWPA